MTKARSNAVANAAKGDLTVGNGTDLSGILAVGSNGDTLVADSSTSTGLDWKTAVEQYPWTTYTPTLNNWTVGNGTVFARYQQIGKTIILFFKFTFGSTSAFPGGNPNFTLPVNASNTLAQSFWCNLQDAGTIDQVGCVYFATNGVYPQALNAAGTYLASAPINATLPFTWTTNDSITVQITYEAV
jgi:hypothetical protein